MGREGHRTRCGWLFIDFVISHFSLDSLRLGVLEIFLTRQLEILPSYE